MSEFASIAPHPARYKWFILATILVASALYLVGNGRVALWDRDEPRYAECSRQMLFGMPGGAGPDWVVPRYLDRLRTEKPPLIYWLQAGAMKVFGDNSFAVRFPSSAAMAALLGVLAWVIWKASGPPAAAWTVFVMASSALTIMSAKMCLTDAVLLLWDTIALLCIYGVYRGNRSWGVTALLWTALGLGGLTKGPIVLAVVGATMVVLVVLDRVTEGSWNFRWWLGLRLWIGLPILTAIVFPWLIWVHHREPTFLSLLFGAAKRHLTNDAEKHTSPPGYYVVAIWALLFPWSLLLPMTLSAAWRNRASPVSRFALAIVIGVWIFQECMSAKLPFYVLPAFPALAYLTAQGILHCLRGERDDLVTPEFKIALAIWIIAVLGMGSVSWVLTRPDLGLKGELPLGGMVALSIASIVYAAIVSGLFVAKRQAAGLMAMGLGTMAVFAILFTAFLPRATFIQVSERVAAILRQHGATAPGQVKMIEYKEPSLAYYQGGTITEEGAASYFDKTPVDQWPKWAVLPATIWDRTSLAAKTKLQQVGPTIHGLSYAGKVDGQRVINIVVVQKK